MSGRFPIFEATPPDNASAFVNDGSSSVSIARLPPGVASVILCFPLCIETIFDWTVLYWYWLCFLWEYPGFISISSPTFSIPCFSAPPRIPP